MTITDKMAEQIENKEKLVIELHGKLDELTDLKMKTAAEKNNILTDPNIGDKMEGVKVTEKSKLAFCDKQLSKSNDKIKWLENDISKIKRNIELCDNRITLYRYMIREMEL